MAVLPICWKIDLGDKPRMKPILDYPACRNLGKVFGTAFTLKLHLGRQDLRTWNELNKKTFCVEIERFLDLSPLTIQGSVSMHEIKTFRRVGLKAFKHHFKKNEKSFIVQMTFTRFGYPFSKLFNGLSMNGHICVDSPNDDGEDTYGENIPALDVGGVCPDPIIHEEYKHLSKAMLKTLDSKLYTDVTIKCKGKSFAAHKSVLSARSPVFCAMLKTDMKEANSNRIDVSEMEPSAIKALLKYMYSGKVGKLSDAMACNLLYAADKYDIPELKVPCREHLKKAVTLKNCCRVLHAAILHDESLREVVFEFVFENAVLVLNSPEYKSLEKTYPQIGTDILLGLSRHVYRQY